MLRKERLFFFLKCIISLGNKRVPVFLDYQVLACLPRASKTEHTCAIICMHYMNSDDFWWCSIKKWLCWQTISFVWQEIEVLEGVEEDYRSTKSKIL